MGMEYRTGYCRTCKARRPVEREGADHLMHLILTILTVGVWLIVWSDEFHRVGDWRCCQCGSAIIVKVS